MYKFDKKSIADLIDLFIFADENSQMTGFVSVKELEQILNYFDIYLQHSSSKWNTNALEDNKCISLFEFLYLITGEKLHTVSYLNNNLELTSFIFSYLGERFSDEDIDKFIDVESLNMYD